MWVYVNNLSPGTCMSWEQAPRRESFVDFASQYYPKSSIQCYDAACFLRGDKILDKTREADTQHFRGFITHEVVDAEEFDERCRGIETKE